MPTIEAQSFACQNPDCPEQRHEIDVPVYRQHGRVWLADEMDGVCRECGKDMASDE
jgi:uncharacterized radical SAM superfamily Fe-S cluster-containing enzyme